MEIKWVLLIKSCVWEVLSAILGFTVVYLITRQLDVSIEITLILLVAKTILLAIYDFYAYKVIKYYKSQYKDRLED